MMDWFPVGTGPYQLTENDPNSQMVLEKNPYYRIDQYPTEGEYSDSENGLLDDANKRIPFVDKIVFLLEKEQNYKTLIKMLLYQECLMMLLKHY